MRGRLDESLIFADAQFVHTLLAEAQRVNNETYIIPQDVLIEIQRVQADHCVMELDYEEGEDADDLDLMCVSEDLMDLDIISIDDEDALYLDDDLDDDTASMTPTSSGKPVDPGCFSFNWGCNRSSSPAKVISKPNYFCGLDLWMRKPEPARALR